MFGNVIFIEALRGLSSAGRPQRDYLICLAIQGLAVLIWWPSPGSMAGGTPVTLFVVLITLAVTLAYHNVRIGAEEATFTKQQSLREWLFSTRVPVRNIVLGYVAGHCLQLSFWLILSAPLLLLAWSVNGSSWYSLFYSLLIIVVLVTVYRLAAACIYLGLGHYKTVTYYGIRALLIILYIILGIVFPASSHWLLTDQLLDSSWSNPQWLNQIDSALSAFLLIHGLCALALCVCLGVMAARLRNTTGQ